MTQDTHDALRVTIRALIENNKEITGASLARETGVSQSAISQYLNEKYKGDNTVVAESLGRWLENRNSAAQELPGVPDFIQTPTVEKIWSALKYAQLTHTVTVIYGNPGVGKTEAIKKYCENGVNIWRITAAKSRSNELETMYELALEIGMHDAPYQRGALSRALRRRLMGTSGLIIIDESDMLNYDALEEMRILVEECGVGLALIGNHKVYDRMTGNNKGGVEFARLFSRIAKKIVINKVLKSDVEAVCDAWKLEGKAERKLIQEIASKPGALRAVSLILPLAAIYASETNEPINERFILAAMRELNHAEFSIN
ncbi:AAA family ATPase [Rahnella contaminans]|uniref:AAA family ATPase n=1 Tax=Rahnella contaminans TaxID=2703882 RepID=UPI003C2E60FB